MKRRIRKPFQAYLTLDYSSSIGLPSNAKTTYIIVISTFNATDGYKTIQVLKLFQHNVNQSHCVDETCLSMHSNRDKP